MGDPLVVGVRGFNDDSPSYLYIVRHDDMNAVKVGIGNHDSVGRPTATHKARGWRAVHVVNYPTGADAFVAERRVLALWAGITGYLGRSQMPQAGWTETIDADAYDHAAVLAVLSRDAAPLARLGYTVSPGRRPPGGGRWPGGRRRRPPRRGNGPVRSTRRCGRWTGRLDGWRRPGRRARRAAREAPWATWPAAIIERTSGTWRASSRRPTMVVRRFQATADGFAGSG